MDKRTIIAVVLSVAILLAWQYFFVPKVSEQQKPHTAAQQGQPQAVAPAQPAEQQQAGAKGPQIAPVQVPQQATAAGQPAIPGGQAAAPQAAATVKPAKRITVETPKMTVTLTDIGGGITSVRLKDYKETLGQPEGKELIQGIAPYRYLPTVSTIVGGQVEADAVAFTPDRGDFTVSGKPETITFKGKLPGGAVLTKKYTFAPDGYVVGLSVQIDWGRRAGTMLLDFATMNLKEKSSYIFKGPFIYDGRKLEQIDKPEKSVNAGQAYAYAGFDEGYFSFILRPQGQKADLLVTKVGSTPLERLLAMGGNVAATLYFVPNKISLLKGLDINADKIVDFGWFDIIAKPMLWGMNYSNRLTHNYGIDIILLTILIKIIFYPLSLKSYKSMKNMQKLQPKLAQLREKYKDNKEKLNQEMMGIYKREGINPLGGCLPMVIQIPVFFALYRVLMAAIEFRHAPFMLWINDLAAPEDIFTMHVAGFALPFRVLPLIMGVTMVIQQKMTPTGGDPMQAKMMMFMPIFFTFLFWGFPSGLVLYWLVNNVISIGQQYYINKQVA
jgi:YidC/Oxa1 family membrane protein insertase